MMNMEILWRERIWHLWIRGMISMLVN